jgi:predicted amidophosphoribosyltransferase
MDCSVSTVDNINYCIECGKKLESWEHNICSSCEELISESLKN